MAGTTNLAVPVLGTAGTVPLALEDSACGSSGPAGSIWTGLREEKEERMEELRTSRSLASRALVDTPSGEPPLTIWEGIADLGFGPGGGDDLPELIVTM